MLPLLFATVAAATPPPLRLPIQLARSTPVPVTGEQHNHRDIRFKLQLDETHRMVSCEFDGSSSLRFGNDPDYPQGRFKPDAAFIVAACAQLGAQPLLYLPRNSRGEIEPLLRVCDMDVDANTPSCGNGL